MRLTLSTPPLADATVDQGWRRLASPGAFYALAGRLLPWCWGAAALFGVTGLVVGLLVAPSDFEQGDAYRILFIHLPAAWVSQVIYLSMALWAGLGLMLDSRLPALLASALAPTGALMTFVALWTGSLWGKPTWGVWWVWNAQLTSELLLLLLYLGFMALQAANDDRRRGDTSAAILALVGVVNIPILYFSVSGRDKLQQDATLSVTTAPDMAGVILVGTLLMVAALWLWSMAAALHRARSILLERERDTDWVRRLPDAR